jgi:type VI secretion system protein ImpC
MAKRFDFGSVNLSAGADSSGASPSAETPFCIAILGDLSGRANRGVFDPGTIGERRSVQVDRDNFEEVLSRFGPEIQLPIGEGGLLRLQFSELEDFHPDRLFERLEAFGKLRGLRSRLQDPSTFKEAAEELGLRSLEPAATVPRTRDTAPVVAPSAARLASGSLLDDMVEQTESRASEKPPRRKPDEVREFAQRAAAKSLVSSPDPRQPEILAVIDRAVGGLMRAVLHNQDFQALEAIWRAIFLLVRQIETSSQLKLYLFDISKQELSADLSSAKDVRDTGLYRLLVEKSVKTLGAEPWSVVVGSYTFGAGSEDASLLSGLAKVVRRAGGSFLAEASPRLLGCSSLASNPNPRDWSASEELAKAWTELRRLPEATAIGLALPRFLLRLPYGEKTSPLEAFNFEEFAGPPTHDEYLWGNPAFALALLLAQSFSESGWDMRPGEITEVERLPLHVYRKNGESESKPCAEVLLTEDAVESILDAGLIPLVSFKGRDSVRVVRFQSIADPAQLLAGRWGL